MKSITDCKITDKKLLIRVDFNVPMANGQITNDKRLRAVLPTIEYALQQGAAVILMSHLGRPQEGKFDAQYSLEPVAAELASLLNKPVQFAADWIDGVSIKSSEIILCENVRFLAGEKANDEALSKKMAALCDVFVMDAFASSHRAHASTTGVAKFAEDACAGLLLAKEVTALDQVMQSPKRPLIAILGGAKVSGKIETLSALAKICDQLIVGGGIANTFLSARDFPIGNSLYEPAQCDFARSLLSSTTIPLPVDVIVAKSIDSEKTQCKLIHKVAADDMIFDVGPQTIKLYQALIENAQTILWNGPLGVFEKTPFASGTKAIAQTIANSAAYTVAGGGDTIAAIDQFNCAEKIDYISTGGGAFLEYIEGKNLPAIDAISGR